MNNNLTRDEAQKALSEGHRLRHSYFAEGEYIEQKKDLYFDELGMAVDQYLFWSIRKGEAFDNGWYIITKNVQP